MPDEAPFEVVTKLAASERQLRAAIRLFFERGDLLAIHTLTTAAKGILQDLCHKRGIKAIIEESDLVRPEKKKELRKILRQPQNFFKHADRDGDEDLKFYFEGTKYFIVETLLLHGQLVGHYFPEAGLFLAWFMMKFPHLLHAGAFKDRLQSLSERVDLNDFAQIVAALDSISKLNPTRGKV